MDLDMEMEDDDDIGTAIGTVPDKDWLKPKSRKAKRHAKEVREWAGTLPTKEERKLKDAYLQAKQAWKDAKLRYEDAVKAKASFAERYKLHEEVIEAASAMRKAKALAEPTAQLDQGHVSK